MGDLFARLASLSSDRRRALEQLLAGVKAPARPEPGTSAGAATTVSATATPNARTRQFYECISEDLDRTPLGRFSRFLNYGYVSDGSREHAVVPLPAHLLNKSSVKLVLELVGDCDLDGRTILDVGCGRGGLLETIATYFRPHRVMGLDLCWRAIASASAVAPHPVTFIQGDAEWLPLASESVDIITNLESSHTYPSIARFYGEAARVLKPGGQLLYSDAVPRADIEFRLSALRQVGLTPEIERDITHNVLLACQASADRRLASFRDTPPDHNLEDFLAVPESAPYEALKTREWIYVIYRLRKSGGHGGGIS